MTKPTQKSILLKIILSCLVITLSLNCIKAQIAEDILPYTYNDVQLKSTSSLPSYKVSSENIDELLEEDKEFPTPYRFAVFENVNIDIKQLGKYTKETGNNGKLWRYSIGADGFRSIQLHFTTYKLPEGARLFIYNEDYSSIYGAFTEKNNAPSNSLMVAPFEGEKAIIEYFEPDNASFEGELVLGAIGKGYKELYSSLSSEDENGFAGINCPEGEFWQNEKHAVCLISFTAGGFGYNCSGAFINNTRNDGKPYFLTAHHCINANESAQSTIAYFNFEQVGCDGNTLGKTQSISGATIKTLGEESDYCLILFNDNPPIEYQPYFAGWDASNQFVSSTVGIHHPESLPKKISIDNDAPVTYNGSIIWDDNITTPKNTHWQVEFEIGTTASGSSGSPLFDNNKRIIGQLHGGDPESDFYGKLSHSWENKKSGYLSLKYYLDPDNTGVKNLDGYYPDGNPPDPQFYPEFLPVCKSAPVKLTGFSAFDPDEWLWNISPAKVTYLDNTSDTSKSPVVSFDTTGEYSISLSAANTSGTKSIYMYNAIVVDTILDLEIEPYNLKDSCLCNFDSLSLLAGGAKKFTWSFKDGSESIFQIVNDTSNPVVVKTISGLPPESRTDINLHLMGTHGSCSSESDYSFPLLQQDNDSIKDAFQIFTGQNGIYSNRCAGIEENEPVPPYTSCTGQLSWCNEYDTGEDIVEHSVWFYFIPTEDNNFELTSKGMDNQIAVYLADSYNDVLSGNYQLIAANDDYIDSETDPTIENLEVEAGNKYWIQVDGSNGGVEGQFYLYLNEVSDNSEIEPDQANQLKIYPQPAGDFINIEYDFSDTDNTVTLEIYNTSGIKIMTGQYQGSANSLLNFDISALGNGLYLVKLKSNDNILSGRFIK